MSQPNVEIQLKRLVYGFRNPEVLGPANFVTTEDRLQIMVLKDNMVEYVCETYVHNGDLTGAADRLKKLAKKKGYSVKSVPINASYCGYFLR
jgi:hypothetical protein